jgi:tetratricopeptide (TPR) repeat protein
MTSQAEGILDQAVGFYERGEYRNTVDLLAPLVGKPDAPAEMAFWLGKSYIKIRKWDKAVDELERSVKLAPSNALYHLWLGRAYGARAENRIFKYNDARRLLKEFKKASELAPDNIDIRFDLLEFYAQAPGIVGGGEDKAWAEAQTIAKLNPVVGYTARATIYERKEKWDPAAKEYEQAVREYPVNANAYKDLAQFLFNREDYEGALSNVIKALELDGKSKQSAFLAAACRIQLGVDLDKAGNSLQALAERPLGDEDPAREDIYYWQGVLYHREGEEAKSKDALEKALEINPKHRMAEEYLKKNF